MSWITTWLSPGYVLDHHLVISWLCLGSPLGYLLVMSGITTWLSPGYVWDHHLVISWLYLGSPLGYLMVMSWITTLLSAVLSFCFLPLFIQGSFTERKPLLCRNARITFPQFPSCPSTTTGCSPLSSSAGYVWDHHLVICWLCLGSPLGEWAPLRAMGQ